MSRIDAPWTADVVDRLNRWQSCDFVHPFTCPGNRNCPRRELTATADGWVCACGGYYQTWAHGGMVEREPPTAEEIFGMPGGAP